MREFWDARAREEAYYFIDNRRVYGDAELAEFWSNGEQDLDHFLGLLGAQLAPDDVALDIGCGVGRLTRVLAKRTHKTYGIDVSEEMLERAREHNAELDNVEWIAGDGSSLAPLPDASIDACVSHVVFQHIPDPQITLGYVREIGRVLRPGGWAAFQVSDDPQIHDRRRWRPTNLRQLIAAIRHPRKWAEDPAWLGSAVDLDDLRRVAGEAHLGLERIVGEGTQFCFILARRGAGAWR